MCFVKCSYSRYASARAAQRRSWGEIPSHACRRGGPGTQPACSRKRMRSASSIRSIARQPYEFPGSRRWSDPCKDHADSLRVHSAIRPESGNPEIFEVAEPHLDRLANGHIAGAHSVIVPARKHSEVGRVFIRTTLRWIVAYPTKYCIGTCPAHAAPASGGGRRARIQAADELTHGDDESFDTFTKASVTFFRLFGDSIQPLRHSVQTTDQFDMGFG